MVIHILLIDNSVTIQKVVELTFADSKYTVVGAHNLQEAALHLQESNPDVIIADTTNDQIDALTFCDHLKNDPDHQSTPIILLVSKFAADEENDKYLACADGMLAKPFEAAELRGIVTQLIEERRGIALTDDAQATTPEEQTLPPRSDLHDSPELEEISYLMEDGAEEEESGLIAGGKDELTQPETRQVREQPQQPARHRRAAAPAKPSEPRQPPPPRRQVVQTAAPDARARGALEQDELFGSPDTAESEISPAETRRTKDLSKAPGASARRPAAETQSPGETESQAAPATTPAIEMAGLQHLDSAMRSLLEDILRKSVDKLTPQLSDMVRETATRIAEQIIGEQAAEIVPEIAEQFIRRELEQIKSEAARRRNENRE